MRISVVIPAYNSANSISNAITSCMQQTLAPYEIIVINDASTDNTTDILSSFPNVKLISLTINSGPSKARNTGWDIATGDIVAFLDADDTWKPNKLDEISKVFANNPEIQLLGHAYDVKGKHESKESKALYKKSYVSILLKNPYQPSCMAIRTELPLRFDETYRYCEDHELATRIAAEKHTCDYLDKALTSLGRPQLSSGGASANTWKMRQGELRLYSAIYKHKIIYLPLIPLLWLYSILKMVYRTVLK